MSLKSHRMIGKSRVNFSRFAVACVTLIAMLGVREVRAVGWDSNDFLISGAPNFPDRIGVFDHDFTFKGYINTGFFGVQGMDFDAQGNLVAIASLSTTPEVRIYSPAGQQIGGFFAGATEQYTGDLKVAPDGNFALGTFENGVRLFSPTGTFVRQYGNGDSRGIEYVPGGRLWSGGAGTTVKIFDTASGAQVGSFAANGQTQSYSMQYSESTGTVLIVDADRDLGGVFERDLDGVLLQDFNLPVAQTFCLGATRGPNGDVFGTTTNLAIDVVRWLPNGTVAGSLDVYPNSVTPVRILWAGTVPEPGAVSFALAGIYRICARPSRVNRAKRTHRLFAD